MRRVLLALVTFFICTNAFATGYTWVGGTGPAAAFNDRSNWSTAGVGGAAVGAAGTAITFTNADVLTIDGSDVSSTVGLQTGVITATGASANLVIGQLILTNNASLKLTNLSTTRSYTVGGGLSGTDLDIQAGSTLVVGSTGAGTSTQTLALVASNTASIAGILDIGNVVGSASVFTIGTANSATVTSTGTYRHGTTTGTFPAFVWNTGSTCEVTGLRGTAPGSSFTQSFYNLIWNCSAQSANLGLGGNLLTVANDFTVTNTNGNQIRLANTSPTITVSGNLVINGGFLSLTGTSGSATVLNVTGACNISSGTLTHNIGNNTSTPVLNLDGNLNISGTGVLDMQFSGSTALSNNGVVNLKGNFSMTGGSIVKTGTATGANFNFAKTGTQTFTKSGGTISGNQAFNINSGAIVDFGTNILDGATGGFTLNSGGGIITASTNATGALTTSGANGSIQVTGTRSYSSGANYTFNGSSAQVTGDFLTATTPSLNTVNNLTINNSTGVTTSAAVTVSGTLTLTSGAFTNSSTLTLANNAIISRANGSIANTPTFSTNVDVIYTGSSSDITTGNEIPSSSTVLRNLTLNESSANVILGGNISVNTALALTAGKFLSNGNTITMKGSSSSISGSTVFGTAYTSYIATCDGSNTPSGAGGLVIENVGSGGRTGAVLFPVGPTPTSYNPITVNNSSASVAFTVRVNTTAFPGMAPGSVSVQRTWNVSPASGSPSAVLNMQWTAAHEGGTFTRATAKVGHYNGSVVDVLGGANAANGSDPYTSNSSQAFTGYSQFGVTSGTLATPDVTLNEISTVGAASIAQATTNNIIYNFKLDVATSDATLSQVTIPTTGNYTSSDITNLKLWYKSSNDFSTAVVIKTISTPAGATTETFSGLSQAITSGNTGFFWVTADVAGGATVGRTITVTPALDQTNFTFSAAVNFTTGTINTGGLQTISAGTSGVTLNRISDVSAGNIQTSSTNNIIYNFKLDVASVAATLTQVVINTSGNYTSSDVTNLKLWYNNANNFGTASTIKTIATPAGATSETFASLSQAIGIGATGYFWITADVAGGATAGRTITVTPALSFTELTFSGATSNTTGTINAGGTQTIVSTPSVALSEISTVGAASIAQATTNNIIYNFKLDVTDASTTVNQVTIATSGDYTSGDLTNLKLWYHTANNFGGASAIKTITPAGASLETFGSLSQAINSGTTGYFWVTADVAGGATVGRTITVTPALAQSNLTFSTAVNFSTGTINAGGLQTVSAGTSGVTLSEISTIGAANISQGSSSNIIYNFKLAVTSVAATLTQVTIPTSGDYTSSDITNLKLWYKSSNDFSTAATIKTIGTPSGATTETFAALSQSIGIGATGFFWVTADVAGGATVGRTITVTPALAFSNLTFSGSTSNTTGTINAGGTQTIVATSNATDAFRSKATGDWNDATPGNVWQSFTNGSWMNATLTPGTSAASITIQNTHTITVPNGASISADDVTVDVGGQITVASGGTLTIANGAAAPDLTVNGYLKNSGTLTMTGTGTISGSATYEHNLANLTIPTFTWSSSSTLEITGSWSSSSAGTTIATLSPTNTYQNVTFNFVNPTADSYISLGGITIAGKLKIVSTGSGAILGTTSTTAFTCNSYEQTGGILYVNRQASGDRGITVTNNADITGGTVYLKINATSTNNTSLGQFTVGGNLTVGASGTFINGALGGQTVSTTAPQLIFNSAGAQAWSHSGAFTNAIAVSVTGAGGVTLNTDLTMASSSSLTLTSGNFEVAATRTLTLSGTASIPGFSGRTLTVNGTLVNSSTATTPSAGAMVLSSTGTYVHNTTASSGNMLTIAAGNMNAASTWIYRGSSSLTPSVSISGRTFGNLTFESTSGSLSGISVSGAGTLTVNGNLSIGGGGAGTMALTFSGYTGTITVASGVTIVASNSFTLSSSTMNVGGNWANSGTFTAGTSIVNFNGTAAQSITKGGGESFSSLTISNTSNTVTAANNLTSGATFTTSAGSILDMGTNTLTVSTVSHAGTLKTQNTGGTPITSGKTWGGTVQYNSASSQTIVNGNYTDLNGTGGDRTLANSGTIGIAGTFTPGAGAYTITGSTIDFNKTSTSQTVNAITYNNLTLSGAATKSFAGNATVQGDFTVSGGAVTAPTTMTFNGGSAQSIAGLAYDNVAFDGAGNKTFNSNGSVATAVTFAAGQAATIDFDGTGNDKVFTVKSTATYTARIENKQSYTLSGSIKAERYYPSRRAWRLMSAPVSATGSIYSLWQNGGTNSAGIGMLITGPGANPGTNGLDVSTQNTTTMYTYNQGGNAWSAVSNTLSTNVSDNAAYFIFVRGDRNTNNLTPGISNTTTLHSTGTIKSGNQGFTTNTGTGYTLLGNPYPSPVDFDAAWNDAANGGGAGTTNVLRKFYTYDPNIGDRGGYVTVSWNGGSYDVVPSSGVTSQTQHIQSGQGFFVEADGSANTNQFTLKESHKSSSNINDVFRAGTQFERLAITLKRTNTDGSIVTMDGILANFHNGNSAGVGSDDASKFTNFDESVSFRRDGHLLSIEAMPLADVNDTLFMNIANMKQRNYELIFEPSSFNAPGLTAYLEDAFTGTSTQLSLSAATHVTFTVTATAATSAADRFRIVFKSNSPLPVSFVNVKAYEKNAAAIQVEWNIASESGVNRYEVEESSDAINFSKSKLVQAKANNNSAVSYSWLDNNVVAGANYYRIRSISNNGEVKLSPVVKVNIGKGPQGITIYPNPVRGNSLSLQMNNMGAGDYTMDMYNAAGQKVMTRSFSHAGGSGTQSFVLDKQVRPGVYQLVVQNGKAERMVQTIIIND